MKLLTKAIEKQLAKYPHLFTRWQRRQGTGHLQVLQPLRQSDVVHSRRREARRRLHSLRIVRQYGRARIWLCVTE